MNCILYTGATVVSILHLTTGLRASVCAARPPDHPHVRLLRAAADEFRDDGAVIGVRSAFRDPAPTSIVVTTAHGMSVCVLPKNNFINNLWH